MELSTVDKQMTDKWHVGTPPPGLIVIALWDCANGISYGERGESEACVSFYTNKTSAKHRMWLLLPLSTVSNLICLSIWVAESEGMLKGGIMEKWNGKEGEKRWIWHESCGSILTRMLRIELMVLAFFCSVVLICFVAEQFFFNFVISNSQQVFGGACPMFKCLKIFLCVFLYTYSLYYNSVCTHMHVFVDCFCCLRACARWCRRCIALWKVGVMYPAVKPVDNWYHGQTWADPRAATRWERQRDWVWLNDRKTEYIYFFYVEVY